MTKASAILALAGLAALSAANTATFDDLGFSTDTPTYENGAHLSGSFTSGGIGFKNAYDRDYGSWEGFSYSDVQDTTTPGVASQYAAYPGAAHSGTNYAVAYDFDDGTDPAVVTLPASTTLAGVYVTNTTYAALSILNGDPFAKKFGGPTGNDPDFFLLTATGRVGATTTGIANFYLADYRFADNSKDYVVKDWTYFDLSGLGGATRISFSLTSSDNGPFGMNTPASFALDDLGTRSPQAVPEPATLAALALGMALVRRRKGGAK